MSGNRKHPRPRYKATEIGEIPEDWEVRSIEEVASREKGAIKIGPFGSQLKKEELTTSGVKVLGIENVLARDVTKGVRFITAAKFEELRSCEVAAGDLLVTMMGTVSHTYVVPEGAPTAVMDSHLLRIRPDRRQVLSAYLSRLFDGYLPVGRQITALQQGAIMNGLNSEIVRSIRVPVPSLTEQERIERILSAVDSEVDATSQVIDATAKLKTGLMQRLLTRGIGRRKFKTTEIGEIPEEWEVVTIADLGRVVTGSTPSTSHEEYYGGGFLFVTPSDIDGGKFVSRTDRTLSKAGFDVSRALPRNAVLVNCIGASIGKVAMAARECTANQQINAIVAGVAADPDFVYYSLCRMEAVIRANAGETAIPIINKGMFSSLRLARPPLAEQRRIASILSAVDDKLKKERERKAKLEELKRGLMQVLLTGKVRVKVDKREAATVA